MEIKAQQAILKIKSEAGIPMQSQALDHKLPPEVEIFRLIYHENQARIQEFSLPTGIARSTCIDPP
jgi:hypothetical protein